MIRLIDQHIIFIMCTKTLNLNFNPNAKP